MNAREITRAWICCTMICGVACLGLPRSAQARDADHKAGTRRAAAHTRHQHTHSAPLRAHRARHTRNMGAHAEAHPRKRPAGHAARRASIPRRGSQSPAGSVAPASQSNRARSELPSKAVDARRIVECGFDGNPAAPTLLTSGIFAGARDGSLAPLAIAFGHVSLERPTPVGAQPAADALSAGVETEPAAHLDRALLPASSDVDFIGMVQAERHDLKVAVLRVGHHVVYGRTGDLLAGRYRLLRFSEEAAQVFDINTAATRTLAMGTP